MGIGVARVTAVDPRVVGEFEGGVEDDGLVASEITRCFEGNPALTDQSAGEIGTPGRARGLYAATTVAPPARVASRNTLPPRSAFSNAEFLAHQPVCRIV